MNKKKVLLLSVLLIVLLGFIFIMNVKDTKYTNSEELLEDFLEDVFEVDYKLHSKIEKELMSTAYDEEFVPPRIETFRKYFPEDKLAGFMRSGQARLFRNELEHYKLEVNLNSVVFDLRETSDANVLIVYATIEYEMIFLEDDKDNIIETMTSEFTLVREGEYWLINFARINFKPMIK